MTIQQKTSQGLYAGHTRAKISLQIARTVLATQIVERPLLPRENSNETQKVLYIACVSFFFLFACTLFDFIAFRS